MTPDEFITLVERLRTSQKEYFRTRSDSSLQESKRLEKLVDQLNHSKVPRRFLLSASEERRRQLGELVAQRRFTLMHLIERVQRAQNSTAWLRIEPNDYVPHPQTLMKWV